MTNLPFQLVAKKLKMGKKNRHSKDRLFITATEWSNEYGGKKTAATHGYRSLPFDHCALTLTPYETPVCTEEGVVFDFVNLFPYVRKHKSNPITGIPMSPSDIIRLNMAKNNEGEWHCPVTCKVFNNTTHVVAIKSTGNVFCYDAVFELNIKPKNFVDLLTSEPFTKADIITLQDPQNEEHMSRRDINTFAHLKIVREDIAVAKRAESKVRSNPTADLVMKEVRERQLAVEAESKKRKLEEDAQVNTDDADVAELLALGALTSDVNPGQESTSGRASASLTSSSMQCWTSSSIRLATAEELRDARWKKLRQVRAQ